MMWGRASSQTKGLFLLLVAGITLVAACTPEEDLPAPSIVEVPALETPQRTTGFDTSTGVIRIGVIADLSGPGAEIARAQVAGAEAYWSTVNSRGGVDGRFPVELVIRDTEGLTANAVLAYRELRERVVMFGQLVGTGTTDVLRERLRADGVVAVPTTRQSVWVSSEFQNLLPVGVSYAVEALSGVSWLSEQDTQPQTWCVVTDASQEGQDSIFGAIIASQELDAVPDLLRIDDTGPGDETRVVGVAIELGCTRLWLAGNAHTSARFLRASALAETEYLVGVGSEVFLPLPPEVAGWARDHLSVVMDAPSWGDSGLGARALRDAVATYVPDAQPNSWIRSGFASQYAVDVVLTTSARSGDLTRSAVLELAARLGPIDTGGLAGSPDWIQDPPVGAGRVIVHAVDDVGVDPLGLRVETTYVSPVVAAVIGGE